MRPTRRGLLFAGLMALTLAAALASGNNLLYLLQGLMLSALLLSAAALAGARGLRAAVTFPERAFQGAPCILRLRLRNEGRFGARALRVLASGATEAAFLDAIGPGEQRDLSLPVVLSYRGRNRLELRVESSFPFGLLRRTLLSSEAPAVALPRPEGGVPDRESPGLDHADGPGRPRKGAGDEFLGVRPHDPADGIRLVNWKLSARSGKLLVNEFAEPGSGKVTVRLDPGTPDEEARVRAAAAACKLHIDRGAEVRLLTPESEVAYGRGLTHLDKLLGALALTGAGGRPRPAPAAAGRPPAGDASRLALLTDLGSVVVYLSLFLIEDVNAALVAAVGASLPLGWLMDRSKAPRVPEAVWRLASSAMLVYTLLFGWRLQGITVANTYLLLYLLANRLLHPKDPASLDQLFLILFLAFFLVSGQTISLWYFIYFLLYAGFAAAWLMRGSGAPGASLAAPLAACLGLCLSITGLVFVATPRLDPLSHIGGILGDIALEKRQRRSEFVVGFTENVSLGFFGHLKKSGARVLRVKPPGQAGRGAPAPVLRIRGSAFDQFDGRRWSKGRLDFRYRSQSRVYWSSQGRAWSLRRGPLLLFPAFAENPGAMVEYTVYPLNSAIVFTHGTPQTVDGPDNSAYFDYTDTVYFGSPYTRGTTYRLAAQPALGSFADSILGYKDLLQSRFLQLPPLDPRIIKLASEITRSADTPLKKARLIERYLQRGFRYSSYSDDPTGDLASFLFSSHRGNCEFFATAAAVLLRSAGVPSRLVTGFLTSSEDFNEYGGFYDVRQDQAHAWTEAYIQGRGWVTLDATPPEGAFAARTGAIVARLRRYFNAAQAGWYRNVIGYDRSAQRDTFFRLKLSLRRDLLASCLKAALGAASACLVLLAPLLGLRLREARAARRATLFERALHALGRSGLEKPPHQTPREFAAAVARRRPGLGALRALAELHYLERYSGRGLSDAERRAADSLLSEVQSAARGRELRTS